jgi:hypothetical protein
MDMEVGEFCALFAAETPQAEYHIAHKPYEPKAQSTNRVKIACPLLTGVLFFSILVYHVCKESQPVSE